MGQTFYDELASAYHLIFEDWDASIRRQGEVLARLLPPAGAAGTVLDCACGIGTRHSPWRLWATPSKARTCPSRLYGAPGSGRRREGWPSTSGSTTCGSWRRLHYGVVLASDNAVPHLESDEEILGALSAMRKRLRDGGALLLSLRDYGRLMAERRPGTPPLFFRDGRYRRTVHQVWDWRDERSYTVHLYITRETAHGWEVRYFVGRYRAVAPEEVAGLASRAGFTDLQVMTSAETGYHQPIVRATRRPGRAREPDTQWRIPCAAHAALAVGEIFRRYPTSSHPIQSRNLPVDQTVRLPADSLRRS